jgi:hypothetical protein
MILAMAVGMAFYGRLKRSRSFPPETSLGALNEGGDVKGGQKWTNGFGMLFRQMI